MNTSQGRGRAENGLGTQQNKKNRAGLVTKVKAIATDGTIKEFILDPPAEVGSGAQVAAWEAAVAWRRQYVDFRRERADALWMGIGGPRMTLDELAEGHFKFAFPKASEKTLKDYVGMYRNHIKPKFGVMAIGDISFVMVDTWLQEELCQSGLKASTTRQVHVVLGGLFKHAMRREWVWRNPARGAYRAELEEKDYVQLSPDQIIKLASAFPERYEPLVLILGFCGLRYSEGAALRWSDFSVDNKGYRWVSVVRQIVRDSRAFDAPKTNAGKRRVPVPRWLYEKVEAHAGVPALRGKELLFCLPDDGTETDPPIHYTNFRANYWAPIIKRVLPDLPQTPVIHDLRHAAADYWRDELKVPERLISTWLGHTDPSFTAKRYGGKFDDAPDAMVPLDAWNETPTR